MVGIADRRSGRRPHGLGGVCALRGGRAREVNGGSPGRSGGAPMRLTGATRSGSTFRWRCVRWAAAGRRGTRRDPAGVGPVVAVPDATGPGCSRPGLRRGCAAAQEVHRKERSACRPGYIVPKIREFSGSVPATERGRGTPGADLPNDGTPVGVRVEEDRARCRAADRGSRGLGGPGRLLGTCPALLT